MTIIVIGASGFIGGHILRTARRSQLTAIGTQSSSNRSDLEVFDLRTDALESLYSKVRTDGPAFVIVAAALAQIDRCLVEREVSRAINVDGTTRLLREAAALGAVPVFLSSSFVFNGRRGNYLESDPRSPISEYGRQKAEVEEFMERELPDGLALRLDKTVGDSPAERHLLSEWWNNLISETPINCIRDQRFSPTFVEDVALGVLLACRAGLRGVYNLCAPDCYLRADLAEQFVKAAGYSATIAEKSQAELGFLDLRPERSSLDSSAFVRATSFTFTPIERVMSSFLARVQPDTRWRLGGM
jgi:dTDP-4-dehydrorhamnose reductase